MARHKGSEKKRRSKGPTRSDYAAVRRVLLLCQEFLDSQFKGTNPVFSVEGVMWSKEDLQNDIGKALLLIPRDLTVASGTD